MLRKLLSGLAVAAAAFAATPAHADICAWVGQSVAQKAATLIKPGDTVQMFCPGCGDTTSKPMQVAKVASGQVKGQAKYYQVTINGEPIDLAYVYIRAPNGAWTNVGSQVSCSKDNDSPKTIAGSQIGQAAQGSDRL